MLDAGTVKNMRLAIGADLFSGTGCPQPGSRVEAADFDTARFRTRKFATLVPMTNGSKTTTGVIKH
jgi:hypothetical protein